ncbi:hypothetical protein BJX96DRAFT_159863 [Aspergillus floccosus]
MSKAFRIPISRARAYGFIAGAAMGGIYTYHHTVANFRVSKELEIMSLQTRVMKLYPHVKELEVIVERLENDESVSRTNNS